MKKLLVVLASVLLIAGTASAGIGVGGGWNSCLGLSAGADIGLGPISIQPNVGFLPFSVGGDVIFRLPSLLDGKITPYAGGGVYFIPSYFGVSIIMFGGKGGVEYKIMDNLVAYGGYGYYIGPVTYTWFGTTYTGLAGGGGFDAGVRFMLVP